MRIVKYPHPTLRHKSKPLRRVDAELRRLVGAMFELMYGNQGMGLAANQVDLPYRLFVVNFAGDPAAKDQEFVFINPTIKPSGKIVEGEEGCLSFPQIFVPVRRCEKASVVAYNLAGKEVSYQFSGLAARAVQHEYDHLDGVLFIDRLSPMALMSVKSALEDLEAEFAGQRDRGLIPDDGRISARLAELEALRAS